jgi:hypothetical protein
MSDPLDALWFLCEQELGTQERMSAAIDKAKKGGTDLGGGQVKSAGRAGLEIGRKPQPRPDLSGGAKQADSGDYLVAGKPQDKVGKVDTSDPQAMIKRSVDTARQSGVPYPVAVQQTTGSPPPIDTPQAKATIATGMGASSQSNDKPGRDGLQQGRTEAPGPVSVSARIHDMEGEEEVSQQNLQEPGRSETDPDLQGDKIKASGSQPTGEDEPSTAGQAVAQKSSDPNKSLSAMAPEFAQKPGFTDKLSSDNETYLNKIQDSGYGNGIDFVDLKSQLGDDAPQGVAGKYLDVLSRALVTKNVKGKTDNWKHYGEGLAGGAGQINSQMGELMTLAMSNIPADKRSKAADIIRDQIKKAQESGSKKGDLTVTEDWLDASLNNAEAIDRYIELEGDGATIVGGAWDQPDELKSLGIGGEGGEEKGFSTDIVIRDSNGKNHQISLKKDGNVNFLNSGAGQYTKYYLSGAAEDPSNPFHDTAKEYLSNIDGVNEIYSKLGMDEYDGESLPTIPSQKKLKDEYGLSSEEAKETVSKLNDLKDKLSEVRNNNDIVPKGYNLSEYNKQENEVLTKNFRELGSEIRSLNLSELNTPASELFSDEYNEGNFPEELYDRFFDEDGNPLDKPKSIRKSDDKEEYDRAKSLMQQASKDAKAGEIKDKIEKIMKDNDINSWENFVDRLEDDDIPGLSQREKNKIKMNAIFATKGDLAKEHRTQMKERERNFASNAIEAISKDPVMKSGTLNSLRKNFPLKDVAEGKESMIIGDATFSKKVLEKMFGTTDFNQIKDKLTVETDKRGIPYLGYQLEVDADDDGEAENIIPIANVNIRADGLGYGNTIKHEMKLRPDFYKRLQKANAELGTNFTAEEILALFFGKKQLFVEAIQHLMPETKEERKELTETIDYDYNDDVAFLRKYGRA